jgi:hypothetical protein
MAQYIDKYALVAEIENLENTYKKCPTRNSYEEGLKDGRLIGYEDALHKINTLEVKDVDLEKEIEEVKHNYKVDDNRHTSICSADIEWLANHFFELGLKALKGE